MKDCSNRINNKSINNHTVTGKLDSTVLIIHVNNNYIMTDKK